MILNVKDKREVSTVTLFHTLGWLPIDVRIHYFTAIAKFNIMNGQAPVDLVNMFTQNNSVHDHNTCGGTEHIKNVANVECFKTLFLKHVSKEVL